MKNKEHPWIKLKRYPHIGFPIEGKDVPKIEAYITNKQNIKQHDFLPFIHRTMTQRKFRANPDGERNEKSKKRSRILEKPKKREIYFANHMDSQIFSYYSYLLGDKYENFIKDKIYNQAVVAYRKIPLKEGSRKNKCNIEFALDAFQFIRNNQEKDLCVVVADVTDFFDSLDWFILKRKWAEILGGTKLPDDLYSVFKALTRVRYVEENQLFKKLKDKIWVRARADDEQKTIVRKQKKISHIQFLKENRAIAYCDKNDFVKNHLHLVRKSTKTKGIPQGTALSATLANIYMIDFDEKIQKIIDDCKGFYQRYSDDLILVFPREKQQEILKELRRLIEEEAKLEIHKNKTKVYHFGKINGKFTGYEVDEITGAKKNKVLEYLGFTYDGQRVLIKTQGFSKFHRSMKRSFKRATSLAVHAKTTPDEIYKHRLYKRFTYKGSQRRMRKEGKKVVRVHDWGNYLTYVNKSNAVFREFNGNDAIKKQSRKTWNRFHQLMNQSLNKIEKDNTKSGYISIDTCLEN